MCCLSVKGRERCVAGLVGSVVESEREGESERVGLMMTRSCQHSLYQTELSSSNWSVLPCDNPD